MNMGKTTAISQLMGTIVNRLATSLGLSFFMIAGLFVGASASFGQITAQTGAVRVVVVDPNGGTVSGAKVTLSSAVSAPVGKETAEDGSAVFPLVTPGSYKV